MKIREGRHVFLLEHLDRLLNSSRELEIPSPFSREEIAEGCRNTIQANAVEKGILRIYLTPLLILIKTDAGLPYETKPFFRSIISSFRRNASSPLAFHKTLNYYENILARREANQQGYDEAILLNLRGEISEGAYSNLFMVKKGRLLTPSLSSGLLPGITRRKVMEIARETGIEVEERVLLPKDLQEADEAFFTSALMGVIPCKEIKGVREFAEYETSLKLKTLLSEAERNNV